MSYVPTGGLALIKGRNGRSQAPYAAPGMLVGRVIGVHRGTHLVDLAMGTGEIIRRVPVASSNIGTRAGMAYLQSISNPVTTTTPQGPMGDFRDDQQRSVYALVHFAADDPGVPVVTGFLHPQVSQMKFDRPGFRLERHESDLYSHTENGAQSTYDAPTDTTIPDFEWFHPSGLFARVGQGTTHHDLTGQDAQGRAAFRGTANANTAMGTAGPKPADFVPLTLKHPSGSGVVLDTSGNVLVQATGQAQVNGSRITTTAQRDKIQLEYIAATDLATGGALTAGGWVDVGTNQSFTIDDATSFIEITVGGNISAGGNAGSASNIGSRLIVDSNGTPVTRLLGGTTNVASASALSNALAGSSTVTLTGLAAGAHTIKVQVFALQSGSIVFCRASTQGAWEGLSIRVIERKR